VIPAGQVVYDSTLDRYFLGDGATLGGNEILGARYDAADRSITFDKLSQGAIDYIDASGGASDHGGLTGLGDDDHTQYLLADGTRTLAGDLTVTGTVDGRDVAADGTKLDGIEAGAKDDQGADEVPFTNAEWAAAGAAYNATDVEAALEQLLVNKAEADTNLGSANQTLTGNRLIDDGDNGHFFFVDLAASGNNSAQFLLNPATPSATWKATKAGTESVTLLNTGDRISLLFQGNSDLAVGTAASNSPGAAGQVLTSNGSGTPPGWGNRSVIRSATAPTDTDALWFHTTDQELYFYDSTRTKWLSVTTFEAHFGVGGTQTNSHFLNGPGGLSYNTGSSIGHVMRYPTTVISAWGRGQSTTSGWEIRISRRTSAGSHTINYGAFTPAGSYINWSKYDLDLDYTEDDLMALRFDNNGGTASSISNHTAVVGYKRQPS